MEVVVRGGRRGGGGGELEGKGDEESESVMKHRLMVSTY